MPMNHPLDHPTGRRPLADPRLAFQAPVRDARTGALYHVVIGNDGLAYRQEAGEASGAAVLGIAV